MNRFAANMVYMKGKTSEAPELADVVDVDSKCSSTYDRWRGANPNLFNAQLLAADDVAETVTSGLAPGSRIAQAALPLTWPRRGSSIGK